MDFIRFVDKNHKIYIACTMMCAWRKRVDLSVLLTILLSLTAIDSSIMPIDTINPVITNSVLVVPFLEDWYIFIAYVSRMIFKYVCLQYVYAKLPVVTILLAMKTIL
jgi:hypothetical protein